MAKDVITRFKLETTAFDSKIKQAAKGLSDYSKTATQAGSEFNKFTQKNVEAARALGTMATNSNNAKQKTQELVGAFNEAAKAYNQLTKEQQQSDWAKALAGSLTQLQQRIREAKQEMQGMGDTMKNVGGDSLFSGGKFDGMLQVFGGNVMTKIAGFAANAVAEMGSLVAQSVEVAKSAEGIRLAYDRLNQPNLMSQLKEQTHGVVSELELMKAAVKFNDFKLPVEELGTMLAFAQQKAKDTGQSVDYMVDSIVTGLGRKSLMILDNLGLSAAEIKEKMAETGDMTKAVGAIIREQMEKAGDYTETAADRAARATADVQDKLLELGTKLQPFAEEGASMWNSIKLGGLSLITSVLDPLIAKYTKLGLLMQQYGNIGGKGKVQNMLGMLGNGGAKAQSTYQQQQTQFWNYINPREEYLKNLDRWRRGERSDSLKQAVNQGRDRFGIDDRAIRAQVDAAKKMLREYQEGAKNILQPVDADINTDKSIKGIDDLKKKLKELESQRRKAVLAGDNDQVENLTKQINATKQNIGYLDPKALKTGSSGTNPVKQAEDKVVQAQHEYAQSIEKAKMSLDNGTSTEADYKKKLLSAEERLWDALGDAYEIHKDPKYKQAQDECAAKIKQLGGEVTASVEAQKAAEQAAKDLAASQKKLADEEKHQAELIASWQMPSDRGIGNFISTQKTDLSIQTYGSDTYNKLAANIADATAYKNLMETAIQNGLNDVVVDSSSLWQQIISGDDIPDSTWKGLVDKINEKLKEQGIQITLDANTGGVKEGKRPTGVQQIEKFNQDYSKIVGGVSSIVSGVQSMGVDIPKEIQSVFGVLQGISAIMTGVTAILTAIEISTSITAGATAVKAVPIIGTFLAGGGIIKAAGGTLVGNSYSGDNLRGIDQNGQLYGLNAGEVVLNKAQTQSLASQLSGSGLQNMHLTGSLQGEDILVSINRVGRRKGLGEVCFFKE